ncbi:MAG: helix-turn-helix transcriptional regulator [Persicimonas sp.]
MKRTLLSEAKAALIDMMKTTGEISVDDAVEDLDLAKTTIRQHLQLLEQYGLVQRRQQRQVRGRPRIMYSLTDKARQFYPSLESELLRELVRFLLRQGHLSLVDKFFQRHWEQYEQRLVAQIEAAGGDWRARIDVLGAFLSEQGFVPEIDRNAREDGIRLCNCPYRAAVEATRLPCRLERELIEKLTGRRATRTGYMLEGGPVCAYELGEELSQET